MFTDPKSDKIKHVIVLALENRSFDQMLGGMQTDIPEIDGAIQKGALRANRTSDGFVYEQNVIYDKQIGADPKHEQVNVAKQLGSGDNSGFIQDFVTEYPNSTSADRLHLMGFYPAGYLPALHTLARHFAVCDRWHSSVPGPTWPNRNFLLSGTTLGKVKMPANGKDLDMALMQTQATIFDRLNEKKKAWKVYFHDIPCSLLLRNQQKKENRARYFDFAKFADDAKDEATFPEFVFIEPRYYGKDENDDHPPHNVMKGQKLIADVYNTIRSNDALWESTLLVVVYDEHGGFYDHVVPPKAIPPGQYANAEYTFDQYGVRVPALLVSPWVKGGVEHELFDHTSILRYLIDKWELGELGERAKNAKSIECAIQFNQQITSAPTKIVVTPEQLISPRTDLEDDSVSDHNQAMIHAWSVAKNAIIKEAVDEIALAARDPNAVKRKFYPLLALLGYGLKKAGERLIKLNQDFQNEEMARTSAEVRVVLNSAKPGSEASEPVKVVTELLEVTPAPSLDVNGENPSKKT